MLLPCCCLAVAYARMIACARSGNQQQTLGELVLACAPMVAYGAQQSRPEEVKVFVIVETDNRWRGHEVIVGVMGPYETEERALEVNAELRAVLPSQYESHDENPTDYTVFRLSPFWVVSDRAALQCVEVEQ